jgi:hypothetical protein
VSAPTGLKRPATLDHLKKKQRMERRVFIPLENEAHDALERAESDLEKARILGEDDKIPALEEAHVAALEAAKDATAVLLFRSMGRKAYEALIEAHPPTPEQTLEFQEQNPILDPKTGEMVPNVKLRPPYNVDTFAPALIAASCVEPDMSAEEVEELISDWNDTEVMELWVAALEVNTQRRVASWGNA